MVETVQPTPEKLPEAEPKPQSWLDLVLYLLVGFGSFFLLSALVGLIVTELSPGASFLLFLANFICLGGTTYLLGVRRGRIRWDALGIRPFRWHWQWLLIGVGLSLLLMPARAVLGLVVQWLLEGNLDSVQARSDLILGGAAEFSWFGFLSTLIGAGLLVPISEELYFRGLLHTWFWGKTGRVWLRVLASAAIFGVAHADSIGVVFASAVIGVVNAIAYERTRSLFIPIVIHITTNSAAVLLLYLVLALAELVPGLM
ncbi:CPBP family intramembrane glutamic endopeptidase [Candidatus Leptofilum sp.]|uniref:CPBP family intramembrane glutamic endopeptidase n=1 Tax=Candidatus Leptofilum sp. TaxID=3241576 RepID=UPI003B5C4148